MNFDMRAFAADLCRFASTAGEEAAAADFVEGELDALGFETYAWDADPELLADHPSFPDDIDESDVAGRRSVAGVLALGGSNNGNPRRRPHDRCKRPHRRGAGRARRVVE